MHYHDSMTLPGGVLVTGATGFMGSHLCHRLLREGYPVRALVRDWQLGQPLREWGAETVLGDMRDPASLARACAGVETVYHCAAAFGATSVHRRLLWETNVDGARSLVDVASAAGVRRLVFSSSGGVHGHCPEGPATEDSPIVPIRGDHYQQAKIAAERLLFDSHRGGRLEVVAFRAQGIYGPRDTRFLKLFRALKRRRFVMIGSGKWPYSMLHVDDLVDGAVRCGTRPEAAGEAFILAHPNALPLRRLLAKLAEALNVPPPTRLRVPYAPVFAAAYVCEMACRALRIDPPLYRTRVRFFNIARHFDISKARRKLDFEPRIDLVTGARQTARWYEDHGLL